MKLPPFPAISRTVLQQIAAAHHLDARTFKRMPEVGIFNAVYRFGEEYILRVPRNHPATIAALRTESIAVPAARTAGVRTPALLIYDDTLQLLPVPFTIYERVPGETLGLLDLEPGDTPEVWRELGRDLATLHTSEGAAELAARLEAGQTLPDPRLLAEARASEGWFTALEARWLVGWLERLAEPVEAVRAPRFLHGDSQATNIMVGAKRLEYLAVLDWGAAAWGDPTWDFAGIPLAAVPYMLQGYREQAPLDHDETAEARILWRHLQLALYTLPRGAVPKRSWAERPLAMLLATLRFLLDQPGGHWRPWIP